MSHPIHRDSWMSTLGSPCTASIKRCSISRVIGLFIHSYLSESPVKEKSHETRGKQSPSMEHHTYIQWCVAIMALPGQIYQLQRVQYGTVPLAKLSSHLRAILQQNEYKSKGKYTKDAYVEDILPSRIYYRYEPVPWRLSWEIHKTAEI